MQPPSQLPPRLSLIEHTAQILSEGVAQGWWRDKLPSERALSIELNVSRPTIRAALLMVTRAGLLTPQPGRQRRLIESKNTIQSNKHKVIGLITPLPLQEILPFSHVWMERFRNFLEDEGYHLEIHGGRRWYTSRPEKELEALTRERKAAAWVLFVASDPMQHWFANSSHVCVLAGSKHPGISLPSVDLNHRATCRHAAGQLISRGHRRIVFLRQGPSSAGDTESALGFVEAFRDTKNCFPVIIEHDGTPAHICHQLEKLLRRPSAPTAILVARPMPAVTVASDLLRRGIRIPQDMAIVSRDNDKFLEFFSPSLACYQVNPQQHAQRLARLVLQFARNAAPRTQQIRIMPQFVPGESLGPVR